MSERREKKYHVTGNLAAKLTKRKKRKTKKKKKEKTFAKKLAKTSSSLRHGRFYRRFKARRVPLPAVLPRRVSTGVYQRLWRVYSFSSRQKAESRGPLRRRLRLETQFLLCGEFIRLLRVFGEEEGLSARGTRGYGSARRDRCFFVWLALLAAVAVRRRPGTVILETFALPFFVLSAPPFLFLSRLVTAISCAGSVWPKKREIETRERVFVRGCFSRRGPLN